SNNSQLGSTVTTTIPGGLADALSSLLRGRNPRWTAQVNFNYPIGMSSADASLATAHVQEQQIEAQLKKIELDAASQVTTAYINLTNAAQSVQAAQKSREYAQR